MKPKEFFLTLMEVFGKPKYFTIAIFTMIIFYSANVIIASYNSLISYFGNYGFPGTFKLFLTFFLGFKDRILFNSFVSLLIITFLFGILLSLIAYRTKEIKKFSGKRGVLATTGIFLGVLAPGCAACGIGLLSALGIGTVFLTFLPYDGLELSILAILILTFAVLKITKDINEGIKCDIKS